MPASYTVEPGDTLTSIAAKHGFALWKDIYYHPDNAQFRIKRPNPGKIFPGDLLVIPSKTPAPSSAGETLIGGSVGSGGTNAFRDVLLVQTRGET